MSEASSNLHPWAFTFFTGADHDNCIAVYGDGQEMFLDRPWYATLFSLSAKRVLTSAL